jgi:isopentenyl-diphosphate delta-isomerase
MNSDSNSNSNSNSNRLDKINMNDQMKNVLYLSSSSSTSSTATTNWDVSGLSQEDIMFKDECIIVNEYDEIIGHDNKYNAHKFCPNVSPNGLLHRAFSVFLFNSEGKLLLQQRAKEKITFPNVWTNTCCSHPLYCSEEIDSSYAIAIGEVDGVKRAAQRKLKHELGIIEEIPINKMKYLGRLHYCAADKVVQSEGHRWGEHEIDYVLFIQADVTVKPNPEEIQDYKYVTLKELQQMMSPEAKLEWSPWFSIFAKAYLPSWWENLNITINTDKYVNLKTIYKINM